MTNLVNSTGRSILPACWTHWYFSNHQPGEHAGAILVTGLPFHYLGGARRQASEADPPQQSDRSIRRFTCLRRDCGVRIEGRTRLLPSYERAPGLSSQPAVKLDVGCQNWGLQRKRSRRAHSAAEVWVKPKVGRGSAGHSWAFGGDQNIAQGEEERRRRLPNARCICLDLGTFRLDFPVKLSKCSTV